MCFNAYFIDIFVWDNENSILKFNPEHYLMKLIQDEGLESEIIATFRDFFLSEWSKLEPNFDFAKWEISFNLASWDNLSATNIKISKWEESIFIWTIFFVIIETIYDVYLDEKVNISEDENIWKNRWKIFENLEYIIIDDPVSSVDDTKIIDISMNLMSVINKNHKKEYIAKKISHLKNNPHLTEDYIAKEEKDLQENIPDLHLKFIITTHHALFYNICYNSVLKSEKNNCKKIYKNNWKYFLAKQWDTPFLYHIHAKNIIKQAIADNDLQRFHFNLFRTLLEKTANFLCYHSWDECLDDENRLIFAKILNNYSHWRVAESEPSDIPDNHKSIFIEEFQKFLQKFYFKK